MSIYLAFHMMSAFRAVMQTTGETKGLISLIGVLSVLSVLMGLTGCGVATKTAIKNDDFAYTQIKASGKKDHILAIFSEKVSFKLPTDWKLIYKSQKKGFYFIEFLPKGETLQDWHNIFVVQGFQNYTLKFPKKTPLVFIKRLNRSLNQTCKKDKLLNSIRQLSISDHPSATVITGCSRSNDPKKYGIKEGQGEIGLNIIIQGKHDLYIIYRGFRGPTYELDNPPLKISNIGTFMQNFLPIQVCSLAQPNEPC